MQNPETLSGKIGMELCDIPVAAAAADFQLLLAAGKKFKASVKGLRLISEPHHRQKLLNNRASGLFFNFIHRIIVAV